MKNLYAKAIYITIIILLMFAGIGCQQPGTGDPTGGDDGGDGGGIPIDPEYPLNVSAVLTVSESEAYVTISWDGDPHDGSYSVVWGSDSTYGNQAARIDDAASPAQCSLVLGEYGTYYFWVACVDPDGEMIDGWESAADQNSSDPITYSETPPPVGAPELIVQTDAGLRISNGDNVKTGTGVGIVPDIPDSIYADVEYQYKLNTGSFAAPSPYNNDYHGLTYGSGTSGQVVSLSAQYYNTSTGLVEDGSPVSMSFTYIDMDGPEIVSINDTDGNPVDAGDRTNLDVIVTAVKPDTAGSGGIFQYSLDGGSSWTAFNEVQGAGTHTFSPAAGSTLDCTNLQIQYYLDTDTFGPTAVNYFTIDKDAPDFPSSPNDPAASGDKISIKVSWYAPADSDLESVSIMKRIPAGSGEYTEAVTYSGVDIPSGSPNEYYVAAAEEADIKLIAADDVGNTNSVELLGITPDTNVNNLFVTPGGTGLGGSWQSGIGDLQEAIEYAYDNGIPEVWVLAGTYKPSSTPNLSSPPPGSEFYHYSLRNGVTVIGGFAGTETTSDPVGGTTTLSGYYSGTFGYDDTYHVFYHPSGTGLNNSAVLKNVTISGGDADISSVSGDHSRGGGMFNSYSSPLLIDCMFSGNSTEVSGGGMYNDHSSPHLINCMFVDNTTTGSFSEEGGAGVHNTYLSTPVFINTIFSDNKAFANGGGVYNKSGSAASFHNCTFHGNTANFGSSHGQAVYNQQSDPFFYNNLIWNTKGVDSSPVYNNSSLPTMGSNLIYTD
ncbi:MAG: hypothetical protein ACP5IA_05240, partial [Sediminispirochaetaceae bacterium]